MGKFIDLTGIRYGRLTVVERAPNQTRSNGKPRTRWLCRCDCGNTVVVNGDALARGSQVSCGCYHKERTSELFTKHGKTDTRLYYVWSGIKNRCYNTNVYEYRWYGGRGIEMCEEWKNDFQSFYQWAMANGYDETAERGRYTVDRINADGNYSPENCRLVSQRAQMNNIRTNHILTVDGESHTIAEWSRITGINQYKIRNRIVRLGWSAEKALQTI